MGFGNGMGLGVAGGQTKQVNPNKGARGVKQGTAKGGMQMQASLVKQHTSKYNSKGGSAFSNNKRGRGIGRLIRLMT